MYLRQLKILGFKSFGHKTEIRFSSGVTAIVGPNGCGKTNILDSLRWVLGEQKTSLLRSGKMEEIIFNGTRAVKPLSMAEVTLVVQNDRGVLPTEYTEVQITRRLFRSGESEYLLNKVPCRRKDIVELFLDTGMGAHSYSVIQTDMIDALLSDKPEERRFLFEEAAGITKYKQRKKAAVRKMDATENDFLRLRDIHAEVKTRVNSLHRQHKKAERYQRLADDVKAWELFLSSDRTKNLNDQKRLLSAELDSASATRTEHETELDQISAQLESDRRELIDVEHRLSEVGSEIYAVSEEAHEREKAISVSREKTGHAKSLMARNKSEIETISARRESLSEQSATTADELKVKQEQLAQLQTELTTAEAGQAEADKTLLNARASKDQVNLRLIDLEGRLSSGKTNQSSLAEQGSEMETRVAEILNQLEERKPRQNELVAAISELKTLSDQQRQKKTDLEANRERLIAEIESLMTRAEEMSGELSGLTASQEAAQARKNILEDMMIQYEGYESGMVSIMDQAERWPSIAGSVGDTFVPVEGLETALEVALGDLSKCLVCYDRATAEDIVAYLKREKKGKVGILVPETGQINPGIKRPNIDLEEFVGWLDSHVSTSDELKHLKTAVLSTTAVFKADSDPTELLKRLPHGFSAVSTDGIFYSGNLISGGSDDRFPLFRRKEKVAEQETLLSELAHKLETVQSTKNETEASLATRRAESVKLIDQIEELSEELDQTKGKLGELDYEQRSLIEEFERVDKERLAYNAKLELLKDRQYNLGLDFTQLSTEKQELESAMNLTGAQVSDLEARATSAIETVSRLQVKQIEIQSLINQSESQLRHNREIIDDITTTVTTKSDEIKQAEEDIAQATTLMATLETELKALFEKRELLTEGQSSTRSSQSEAMNRVKFKEDQIKTLRSQRDRTLEQTHQIEIRINSLEAEIKSIRERIADEYGLDIASVEATPPTEGIEPEEAGQKLSEQKEKLKDFGAVNLLALEEYQVAHEREAFLSEQLADLTTAKKDLQTTITKINQTARQLFHETFDKVRLNFQGLFVELFNGGEADIRLEDTDDPLESNIEIMARPRGKKILSITQMSGGERALTAIALLFSLYMEKPSPFCILDEIDAPLDDANCHRFLKIIRNFSRQTQFLIITHNKITMEAADNLYGITMQEAGISKLVAVKFNEADEYEVVEHETDDEALPEAIAERISAPVNIPSEENE